MELISKEKLKEVIEPMVGKFDDDGEFWWTRESILRAIDNAPTIEEREEGEWIHNIHYGLKLPEHRCSICGEWEYSDTESKYCPNCGAKMKGE